MKKIKFTKYGELDTFLPVAESVFPEKTTRERSGDAFLVLHLSSAIDMPTFSARMKVLDASFPTITAAPVISDPITLNELKWQRLEELRAYKAAQRATLWDSGDGWMLPQDENTRENLTQLRTKWATQRKMEVENVRLRAFDFATGRKVNITGARSTLEAKLGAYAEVQETLYFDCEAIEEQILYATTKAAVNAITVP